MIRKGQREIGEGAEPGGARRAMCCRYCSCNGPCPCPRWVLKGTSSGGRHTTAPVVGVRCSDCRNPDAMDVDAVKMAALGAKEQKKFIAEGRISYEQQTHLVALRKEVPPERPKVPPMLASLKRENPLVENLEMTRS